MTKKLVLKLGIQDEKAKQKAMKAVSSLSGIESLAMDMNDKKLTIVGAVDPIQVVRKLKKFCHTELVTVGPAKEPEKKEEPKKEEPKKDDEKKSEKENIDELLKLYKSHYPHYTQYYHVYSAEENPNSCVIC